MHNTRKFTARALMSSLPLWLAAPAHAHHMMDGQTPQTAVQGFLSGLAHPVIGLDHFAFLVVAALLSFTLSGKARYLVPVAFVGATLTGTLLHLGAFDLPLVELVVALSVLGGGVLLLSRAGVSAAVLGGLFAAFGLFHGYAYGESIVGAETGPLFAYLAGFTLVQYGVIVAGMQALVMLSRHSTRASSLAARTGGAFAAATGAVFLAMNLA